MSPETHYVCGPPGTGLGKTFYLARQAERAVEVHGRDGVAIASLTRAAAAEIAGRTDVEDHMVGTLHGHAFRALDQPKLAETAEGVKLWNEAHPHAALGRGSNRLEDATGDLGGDGAGDDVHGQVMRLRAAMVPRSAWTVAQLDHDVLWTDFKAQTGRLDFTDLIERCAASGAHYAYPRVLLVDEAQDLSRLELELVKTWGAHAGTTVIAGDLDQCQPGDALVSTPNGRVAFADLDPGRHTVLSFDRHDCAIYGHRRTYPFEKAQRHYRGQMLTISARDDSAFVTRCTPNHRWPIRWRSNLPELNIVYLMRQGTRWRVGWCQLFVTDSGSLHLARRANIEKADETWVLSVHTSKRAASIAESVIAARYGLPLVMFKTAGATSGHYDQGALDSIFDALDPELQRLRAHAVLAMHGRDPSYPLLTREAQHAKNGKRNMPLVHACNLIPEAMMVAVTTDERTPTWVPFEATSKHWEGTVYSLNVEPHHTYIADGLITGNSIYTWRGSDPRALQAMDFTGRRVLEQSHRVPRAVHALAMTWIRGIEDRDDVSYLPTDVEGQASVADFGLRSPGDVCELAGSYAAQGRTVMVLASCGYMLGGLLRELKERGTPFHNPYAADRGQFNPMRGAGRLKAFLAANERVWGDEARCWTWDDLRKWMDPLTSKGVLVRGAKTYIEAKCLEDRFGETRAHDEVPLESVIGLLDGGSVNHPALHGDVEWWARNLLSSQRATLEYPLQVWRRSGATALGAEPKIITGTVHSVKGGEASTVLLCPDNSNVGHAQWRAGGAGGDSIRRLFYVATTRAREEVVLLAPSAVGGEHVSSELRRALDESKAVA